MNMSLREAVIKRVEQKSREQLETVLHDSMDGPEQALPGIGVLFELIWKRCTPELRIELTTLLEQELRQVKTG